MVRHIFFLMIYLSLDLQRLRTLQKGDPTQQRLRGSERIVQETFVPAQVLRTTTDNFKEGYSKTHGDLGAGQGEQFGYSVKGRLKATTIDRKTDTECNDQFFQEDALGEITHGRQHCCEGGSRHSTSDNLQRGNRGGCKKCRAQLGSATETTSCSNEPNNRQNLGQANCKSCNKAAAGSKSAAGSNVGDVTAA